MGTPGIRCPHSLAGRAASLDPRHARNQFGPPCFLLPAAFPRDQRVAALASRTAFRSSLAVRNAARPKYSYLGAF